MTDRWYVIDRSGIATLCDDKADAEEIANYCNEHFMCSAPHRAVRLVDAAEVEAAVAALTADRDHEKRRRQDAEEDAQAFRWLAGRSVCVPQLTRYDSPLWLTGDALRAAVWREIEAEAKAQRSS